MKYKVESKEDAPRGNNKDSLKEVFAQKDLYENLVVTFPWEPEFLNGRVSTKGLYGKVDDLGFPVVPSPKQMISVESGDNIYHVLRIVEESFSEMKKHYDQLILQNKIDKREPYLTNMELTKASVNHVDFYNSYLKQKIDEFNREFIKSDEVKNYKEYESKLRDFVSFLSNHSLPFTMAEYTVSKWNPPTQTGLVIQIADGDSSDDSLKYSGFYENSNFSMYQKTAYRYGFRVDKNSPWTLYYDMTSPYAVQKQNKEGVFTMKDFFKRYYTRISDFEIPSLPEKIINLYESYREYDPEYTVFSSCGTSRKSRKVQREKLTVKKALQDYSEKHWFRLYSYIRAIETGKEWSQYEFDKLNKEVQAIYTYRSERQAIDLLEAPFTDRTHELFQKRDLTKENSFDRIITDFRF